MFAFSKFRPSGNHEKTKISSIISRGKEVMGSSRIGLEILIEKVRHSLGVRKNKAREIVLAVASCLEETLKENLGTDGFALKLHSFGKFTVRHRAASLRKIPLTGKVSMTSEKHKIKFVSLGELRKLEKVKPQPAAPPLSLPTQIV